MKNINFLIRGCRPEEYLSVLSRVDEEFVLSKRRALSLGQRFPNAMSVENLQKIRVAVYTNNLCATCTLRPFSWIADGTIWRGAMVGMVWVDPALRGRGVGSRLLASLPEWLQEQGVDFGILWTGSPSFYERAGWFSSDLGLFGEAPRCGARPSPRAMSCQPVSQIDPGWIEGVRAKFHPCRIARTPLDYRAVPIPATRTLSFITQGSDRQEGFALVGEAEETGFFYEVAAPPEQWGPLWAAVSERFERLFVNGRRGDPFSRWLSDEGRITWCPQQKAMWLRVSRRSLNAPLEDWHIPYFDWI